MPRAAGVAGEGRSCSTIPNESTASSAVQRARGEISLLGPNALIGADRYGCGVLAPVSLSEGTVGGQQNTLDFGGSERTPGPTLSFSHKEII